MEFTVNVAELHEAVRAVDKIAPLNSPIQLLSCAYIECDADQNTLTIYSNSFMSAIAFRIGAKASLSGSAAINARLLLKTLDVLLRSGYSTMRFSERPDGIGVECGTFKLSFPKREDSFPKPIFDDPDETMTVSGAQIYALAQKSAFAAADEKSAKDTMKGVYMTLIDNTLSFAASDGYRIARALDTADIACTKSALIPAAMLRKFASIARHYEEFNIGITERCTVFRRSNMTVSIAQIPGTYFDVDAMFKYPVVCQSEVAVAHLYSIIESAAIACDYAPVKLSVLKGAVSAESTGETYFKGTVPTTNAGASEKACTYLHPERCLQALREISGLITLSLSKEGHLFFFSGNSAYFQVATKKPAAPKAKKSKKEADSAKAA
ncbi:hypothetical protein LJC32_04625 [Oscillospiraceae bacterium OttesenSCG-928-F05]|nr:hypothetical protein [Oscillospiraceae bacterium OttesenSCG-928-F05]